MLHGIVARDLAPGTNLHDSSIDVWAFLLPSLEPPRALCLGSVPSGALEMLRRGAGELIEASAESMHLAAPHPATIDLLVVNARELKELALRADLAQTLRRALTAEATLVVLGARGVTRRRRRIAAALIGTSIDGRALTALGATGRPLEHRMSRDALLLPHVRTRASAPRTVRRLGTVARLARARLERWVRRGAAPTAVQAHPSDLVPRRPVAAARIPRQATLMLTRDVDVTLPPGWLQTILREAGVRVPLAGWAFAPPRGYRSQKALFLLGPAKEEPEVVVKVTQEPRFNSRLDNEVDALRRVASERLADPATVPVVLATARHAGLSVAVESAWVGAAFRELSSASPDCPYAEQALEWFTALAERSAAPNALTEHQRREEIADLLDRYLDAFHACGRRRQALRAHGEVVATAQVPTVFFHGDPGNWNLRARRDGTIGVLDWENADPAGPPVWDVALFLATFGSFVAEAEGRRYTSSTFAEQFRPGSPMRVLIDRTLMDYGQRVGIAAEVVGSLMVLCWVHQALKEMSRLPSGAPSTTHHHEILQFVLDEPALAWVPSST